MSNQTGRISLALKGMAMGIAEVIPGVSGGTIALITGIYEELIDTIRSFDLVALNLLRARRLREAWNHINGFFLLWLLLGMAGGIVAGVFGVSHLMETYPEELWGFFFGLILASAIYIGKGIRQWNLVLVGAVLAGVVFAFLITGITPSPGNAQLWYVYFCGAVAICALILPGISGSFILLLLGMYTTVIPAVKRFLTSFESSEIVLLGVFALGCVTGLVLFSRVLSWMFKHYRQSTLALLTGIMLGSLNKIWPWRNPVKWINAEGEILTQLQAGEELRVLRDVNVLPGGYTVAEPNTFVVIICAVTGFALVFAIEWLLRPKRSGR